MTETNEALFLDQVCTIARLQGWLVFHPTPHRVGTASWRTDGKGFPDLVLCHMDRGTIFAELKTNDGRLSEEQKQWGYRLTQHSEYHVWRPRDLETIAQRLGSKRNQQK